MHEGLAGTNPNPRPGVREKEKHREVDGSDRRAEQTADTWDRSWSPPRSEGKGGTYRKKRKSLSGG